MAIEIATDARSPLPSATPSARGASDSLFRMMGTDLFAPDYATISRRPALRLHAASSSHQRRRHFILIVDGMGLSIVGEGKWAAAKNGRHGARGWNKLHLAGDQSGVIVAQALTEGHVDVATNCSQSDRCGR